jgi:AcrR family transcriptional regulator
MASTTGAKRRARFAGLSAVERRAERRRLLLDTAFDLLASEGWSGTSVRAICAANDLNPRYFYENFENLDALVIAVYDRLIDELRVTLVSALDAAPPELPAQVAAAVEAVVGFVVDDRRRARVLYVEPLGNEAVNRRRVSAGYDLMSFLLHDAHRRRRGSPDGDPIGATSAAALIGGLSEIVTAWIDGHIRADRQTLVADVTTLFVALLDAASTIAARRAEGGRG